MKFKTNVQSYVFYVFFKRCVAIFHTCSCTKLYFCCVNGFRATGFYFENTYLRKTIQFRPVFKCCVRPDYVSMSRDTQPQTCVNNPTENVISRELYATLGATCELVLVHVWRGRALFLYPVD